MSAHGSSAGKGRRVPATLVILSTIVLVAAVATLVLPRGEYQREQTHFPKLVVHTVQEGEDLAQIAARVGAVEDVQLEQLLDAKTRGPVRTLTAGARVLVPTPGKERKAILPGSYARTESGGAGLFAKARSAAGRAVLAPIHGFIEKAQVIAFVFLIGGAFGVLLKTGAIDLALLRAVGRLGQGRLRLLVIPVSMLLFSTGGATFGMGESTIAFVLVTVPLSVRLGYDTITGVAICYMASQVGFAGAYFNPFTIGIAQSIAELPYMSGLGFRLVTWVLVTGVAIAFVTWWAERVRKNPELSPTPELDAFWRAGALDAEAGEERRMALGDWLVVLVALSTIFVTAIGVSAWGWFINEMAALFLVAAVVGGLCGGFRPGRIAREFTEGAKTMMEPALIIALSAGVLYVLREGQVLDTILYSLAKPLEAVVPAVGAVLLMCVQAFINFFVPSGSGQAAMTMPVVTPLCDIIGLERQVGVLAFQFGDGFGNTLIPTSAVLMGVLGAARIPWTTWVRWVWPLILILHLIGAALLVAAVYGPQSWMEWPAG